MFRKLTLREELVRIAISGGLWLFPQIEEDEYIRENLLKLSNWEWINDIKDHTDAMERIIDLAEKCDLPYSISDDRTCFYFEGEKETDGVIYEMLIEIPTDDPEDPFRKEEDLEVPKDQ